MRERGKRGIGNGKERRSRGKWVVENREVKGGEGEWAVKDEGDKCDGCGGDEVIEGRKEKGEGEEIGR